MDKTEQLLKESEALIAEAERKYQQTSDLFKEHGIERGSGRGFIDSGKVPASERNKAQEEIEQFRQELENEVRQASLSQQPSGSVPSFTPRRGIPV